MLRVVSVVAWLAALSFGPLTAQDPPKPVGPLFHPSLLGGASWFVGDFGESEHTALGGVVRGGLDGPGYGLGIALAHWPDVGGFRLTGAQAELDLSTGNGGPLTPVLTVGLGYTGGRYEGSGVGLAPEGISASYGLAFAWRIFGDYGLRAGGLMRTDDGGWNGEFRVLGGWMPPTEPRWPVAGLDFEAMWLAPISGPWRLVEPVYTLTASRPAIGRLDVALTMGVVHWQIPSDTRDRGYSWDTRMFVAMPALRWNLAPAIDTRVGPLVAAMGEGPDNGATGGAHARIGWTTDALTVPIVLGLGAVWIALDGTGDMQVDGTDQVGLTLHGGIHW